LIGKVFRTILLVIGWLSVGFGLMGLAVSVSQGIQKDDVAFIIFFFVAGAGIIFLVKRAEKKAEQEAVVEPVVLNINLGHNHDGGGEVRQITCEGCGASLHVDEGVSECEYCGSHIIQA